VRAWAEITPLPKPAVVEGKDVSKVKLIPFGSGQVYKIFWKTRLPAHCPAVATVDATHTALPDYGYAVAFHSGGQTTFVGTFKQLDQPALMGVNVAVIC
jgi:hypothetical protein